MRFLYLILFLLSSPVFAIDSVDAGSDDFVEISQVFMLDATITGTYSSIQWSKVEGSGVVVFSNTAIEDPTVTFSLQGVYILELSVDGVSDTITVYVYDNSNDTMIAHWDFDDVDTDANIPDVTGNGYDGICTTNEPNFTDGYIYGSQGACNLDEPQAKWSIEDSTQIDTQLQDLTYGYTLSVWFKIPEQGVDDYDRAVYLEHDCVEMTIRYNRVRWIKPADAVYSDTYLDDNQWHHFVGVYDPVNNQSFLYLDGVCERTSDADVREFSFTGDASYGTTTADAYIGGKPSSNDFDGALDDVRLYNYPMSFSEVSDLYHNCLPISVSLGGGGYVMVNQQYQLSANASGVYDSVLWSKVSGPGDVNFSDSSAMSPTVAFDQQGVYELQFTAYGPGNTASDTVKMYVYNPSYNQLLGHWDFDNIALEADMPDITGNGYDAVCSVTKPTVMDGHINDSNAAVDLSFPQAYWDIQNPVVIDSNIQDMAYGSSVSVWLKVPSAGVNTDYARVISVIPNKIELTLRTDGRARWIKPNDAVYSSRTLNDNQWHHVVGVYNPVENYSAVYIDGFADGSGDGDIYEGSFTGQDSYIANNKDINRQFNGCIDDLRVYNYALSADEIQSLAQEGDRVLYVEAGSGKTRYAQQSEALDPVVIDDGTPDTANILWSVTNCPNDATVIFSDVNSAETKVTFSLAGSYQLEIEADNGSEYCTDTVNVTVLENIAEQGADPDIIVAGDTLWMYTTCGAGDKFYAHRSKDLVNWNTEEPILTWDDVNWVDPNKYAWAPGIAEKDGLYYLYFSAGPSPGASIGVAVGTSPAGPFVDSGQPLLVDQNDFQAIDAMVFTDPVSEQSYFYAGGGGSGTKTFRVFELNSDMMTLGNEISVATPTNFAEGSFMVYRDGIYYLMYSYGGYRYDVYSVHYSTSSTPYGPWTYRGAILESNDIYKGPGHHSVLYNNPTQQWIIFYHRWENQTGSGPYEGVRTIAVDELEFYANGLIKPVVMTENGIGLTPLGTAMAADITGDWIVNYEDLSQLLGSWLDDNPAVDIYPAYQGDGIINFFDYYLISEQWFDEW